MNRLISIFTLTTLISIPGFSLAQGIWTYYTHELPGEVSDMTQDKQGNYWLATSNGVCKLETNGLWTILKDTLVWDSTMYFKNEIEIDQKNNKWFVGLSMSHPTKEYVVRYDDSTFAYYNPSGMEEENWIASLGIDSSDHIWAGSMDRLAYWFDGKQWYPFYVPGTFIYDVISEFRTDRNGILYIGHSNGISTLNGWLWGGIGAGSFAFDKDNRLWFGTSGVGVYDGLNFKIYTKNDGLLANAITGVVIDSNQNVWASYGEYAKGVSKFNGQQWTHLTHQDGLLDDAVCVLFVDRKGRIWFASIFNNGLSVYLDTTATNVKHQIKDRYSLKNFTLEQNFPNPFNSETIIHYELHKAQHVQLSVLNLNGEEVSRLVSGKQQNGFHQVTWNGKDKFGKEVSSGIYLCVLKINNFVETKKMILIH